MMPERSRDNMLAFGLVIVMVLITIVAVIQQVRAQTVDPPLTSFFHQCRWSTSALPLA